MNARARRPGGSRRATVQNFKTITMGDLRCNTRAVLPCGCAIYVGVDRHHSAGTAAQPCPREGHARITDRSSGVLRELIAKPAPGRLLVETCKIALEQAAREMG